MVIYPGVKGSICPPRSLLDEYSKQGLTFLLCRILRSSPLNNNSAEDHVSHLSAHCHKRAKPKILQKIKCLPMTPTPLLQMRRVNRDNYGIIGHISIKNTFCDPSLEPSHRDGSNEGSQHMFSLRNKKNYL